MGAAWLMCLQKATKLVANVHGFHCSSAEARYLGAEISTDHCTEDIGVVTFVSVLLGELVQHPVHKVGHCLGSFSFIGSKFCSGLCFDRSGSTDDVHLRRIEL